MLLATANVPAHSTFRWLAQNQRSMTEEMNPDSTLSLTADIVGAYVSKNPLPAAALTDLIGQIHRSLSSLSSGKKVETVTPLVPAVSIKKSVTPDYIISLEDGRKFKSMSGTSVCAI
jgi:predicted transcriptional regulator